MNLAVVEDHAFLVVSPQEAVSLVLDFTQLLLIEWFLTATDVTASSALSFDLLNVIVILVDVLAPSLKIGIGEGVTVFELGLENSVVVFVPVLQLYPVIVLFGLLVSLLFL